jgi:hypothetical protein
MQAGDLGALVSPELDHVDPAHAVGIHLDVTVSFIP